MTAAGAALSRDGDVVTLFTELVAIPSPSGRERVLGEALRDWLAAHDVAAGFDEAGASNDSDAGNLVAHIPGSGPVLLFVAHMDTVESGAEPVTPVRDADGTIRSAGATILGADNKSAVAATLRLCARVAATDPRRRPTVIAAFTCREEAGRMGASLLRPPVAVDCGFSVDGSSPIGTVITRALGQQGFTVEIRGRASHAAADPEAGVSAIRVAAEAIAAMPLGRLPDGGSASIAAVVGGGVVDRLERAAGGTSVRTVLDAIPTNSVPDLVLLRGEVRGYDAASIASSRADLEAAVARACATHGAGYAWTDRETAVPPFPGAPDSRALALARDACARAAAAGADVRFATREVHATLEANYLCGDMDVVALASGGRDAHQHDESITVGELHALEALLVAIVDEAVAA